MVSFAEASLFSNSAAPVHLTLTIFKNTKYEQGQIYSQHGPVQKKCGSPSTGAADPIFPGKKTGDFFLLITRFTRESPIISGMQKFAAPFVGAPFCEAPVRPNMLNMPKSASEYEMLGHEKVRLRNVWQPSERCQAAVSKLIAH